MHSTTIQNCTVASSHWISPDTTNIHQLAPAEHQRTSFNSQATAWQFLPYCKPEPVSNPAQTPLSMPSFSFSQLLCVLLLPHVPYLAPVVSLHHQLVSPGNQLQAIVVVELDADVLAKGVAGTTWGDAPPAAVIRVRPQEVAHGALMRHLQQKIGNVAGAGDGHSLAKQKRDVTQASKTSSYCGFANNITGLHRVQLTYVQAMPSSWPTSWMRSSERM